MQEHAAGVTDQSDSDIVRECAMEELKLEIIFLILICHKMCIVHLSVITKIAIRISNHEKKVKEAEA